MYSNAANIRQSLLIRQGHGKIGVFHVNAKAEVEVEKERKAKNITQTFFCSDDT